MRRGTLGTVIQDARMWMTDHPALAFVLILSGTPGVLYTVLGLLGLLGFE